MIRFPLLIILLFGRFALLFAQSSLPAFASKEFRSLEVKAGKNGLLQMPVIPNVNVLYQRNIGPHLAAVFYSEAAFSAFTPNPEEEYLVRKYFRWVGTAGLGGTTGKKGIGNSLFLLAGGRYYHSHAYVQEDLMPELVTSRLMPELGLLYDLKIGKKQTYFSFQHYIPLHPFRMLLAGEVFLTTSLGIGVRL